MEENRRISLGPEFLRCGICLDAFTNPKALSCLHTFCRDCLAQYAARRSSFPCPNCRRTVFLPSHSGIDGLPDNFWLSNIKEELTKKKKKNGALSGEEKCAVHQEEKKRWFCENCKHPICDECIVESHNGHRVTKFKELLAAKREEMHSLRQAVTEQVDSMKTQLEKTEEEGRKIIAMKGKVEAEIRNCAQAWCDMIRQKERQLLDKTATVTEETQILCLEDHERMRLAIIDISTMLDKVKATTDEGNLDEVLRGVEVLTTLRQNADEVKQTPAAIETSKISFTPLEVWPTELGEVKVSSIPDRRVKGRNKNYRDSGQLRMGGQHLLFPRNPSNRVASSRVVRVGGQECGQGALEEPSGLAVTTDKKILVSDWAKQVIQVFDQNGRFVRNVHLNDRGKVSPGRLAIDSKSRRIYLQCTVPCNSSRDKKIIKVLSDQGRHLFQLGSGLRRPHGVSCHTATGNIAILDTDLRMVVIMSRDGERQMSTFGCNLEHNAPPPICLDSIAVAPNGDIVMADWWYSCVKVFDPEGHVRFTFGSPGERGGQLNHPGGVCVDSRGNIIVADERNGRVQMFDASGNFARVLASRSDGLEFPNCVAAVDDGKIAVTDDGKKCVFLIEHDRA